MSDVCQTLVQKCNAQKALILAVGPDNRPLASRRAAHLIASGQSAAAVLEDMSKAIQVRSYNDTDRDLSCLVAIGIGGSRGQEASSNFPRWEGQEAVGRKEAAAQPETRNVSKQLPPGNEHPLR